MTNRLLFPALVLGLGALAFFASRSLFSRTQLSGANAPEEQAASAAIVTSESEPSTRTKRAAASGPRPRAPKTVIRRHTAPPRLSPQQEASLEYPKRTNNMRNMIGLSLSERRDELKRCVVQEGLPFSTSTIRFHVDSSSESMVATAREVIAVPDSLRQCIAAELGTYEIAAEEGAPFLDGYSDTLDISLTINEPSAG